MRKVAKITKVTTICLILLLGNFTLGSFTFGNLTLSSFIFGAEKRGQPGLPGTGKRRPFEGKVLAGSFCRARLLFIADTPIEGSSSGTRLFIAQLLGMATCPSGNKIDMDKNIVIGYALGDAVDDRIRVTFRKLTYYFGGEPMETDITAYAAVNGKAGIPSMAIISKESENVLKVAAASTLEAMSLAFQRGYFTPSGAAQNNSTAILGGQVVNQAGSSSFSQLAEYYMKLQSQALPELVATNATEIEFVVWQSFPYLSKEFVNNEAR